MHESPLAELSPILYQLLLDVAPDVAAYSLLLVNSNSHHDMVRTIYSEKQKSEVRYTAMTEARVRTSLCLTGVGKGVRVIAASELRSTSELGSKSRRERMLSSVSEKAS